MNNLETQDNMLKRIKIGKHLDVILGEMCKRVGTELSKVDILQNNWHETHTWSIPEEQEFQKWMFEYLVQNQEALFEISTYRPNESISTKELMTLVKEFTLFYGWALEDEVSIEYIVENKPKKN